jgi:hypothetical protein
MYLGPAPRSGPIRRIGFGGGPCTGKSTLAARVFADLKAAGYDVEFVPEWIKPHAYARTKFPDFASVYILGKQMHEEERFLKHVDLVVAEYPLFLSVAYARLHETKGWGYLEGLVNVFEEAYPSLNFLLERGDIPFKSAGRFQEDASGVGEIDEMIAHTIRTCGGQWYTAKAMEAAAGSVFAVIRDILESTKRP